MICDLGRATVWLSSWGSLPILKKLLVFRPIFGFVGNHISVDFLEPAMMRGAHHCRYGCASSKIDIDDLFEPAVIWRYVVVCGVAPARGQIGTGASRRGSGTWGDAGQRGGTGHDHGDSGDDHGDTGRGGSRHQGGWGLCSSGHKR